MELIPIVAKSLSLNMKQNHVAYTTNITAPAGILLLADETGSRDMFITDQIHTGGEVKVIMKPTRHQANKLYEVGDLLGYLLIIDGEK